MVEHLMRCGGKNDKRGTRKTGCMACGNETEFEKSVKNHALLHVLPDASDDRPLACPIPVPCCANQCGRVFYSRTSLYQHVVASIAKRMCAPHQREECLNRLLDQAPAALTFDDVKTHPVELERARIRKIPRTPDPQDPPPGSSRISTTSSQPGAASQLLPKPLEPKR